MMRGPILVFLGIFGSLAAVFAGNLQADANSVPSQRVKDNWARLAGSEIVGRIKSLEPWGKFADPTKCKAFPEMCSALAMNLRVAIAVAAEANGEELSFPVVVAIQDKLRPGDFVRFKMPVEQRLPEPVGRNPKQILESIPDCRWALTTSPGGISGVTCNDWSYESLRYLW